MGKILIKLARKMNFISIMKINFLLISNNEIAMTNDFSSHNCKLFNFTRNPEGYKEPSPGLMNELISKLKYFYASLF